METSCAPGSGHLGEGRGSGMNTIEMGPTKVVHRGSPAGGCRLEATILPTGKLKFGVDNVGNWWSYCPTCGERLPEHVEALQEVAE